MVGFFVIACMCMPLSWVGTKDGSSIPTRGAVYVYRELVRHGQDTPVETRWFNGYGAVSQERISPLVIKLTYEGRADSTLVVVGYAAYTLTDNWHPPEKEPRLVGVSHEVDPDETCGPFDTLLFTLDQPAAAIRVRWRYFTNTREWIVPQGFLDDERMVPLGKHPCGRTTIPPHEIEAGGNLELFEIRLDGTEVPVLGLSREVSTDMLLHPEPRPPAMDVVDFELTWWPWLTRVMLVIAAVVGGAPMSRRVAWRADA